MSLNDALFNRSFDVFKLLPSKNSMKKITVNFDVNFGSDFQRDFFLKMLQAMLDALKIHMDTSHKDNKLTYEIDTNDGYKIRKV